MLQYLSIPGFRNVEPYCHDVIETPQSVGVIYTVGHGDRSAADFLNILRAAAIDCVADVRAYPVSRRHPQFTQKHLAPFLDEAGIAYCWLGKALGGFREASSSSVHAALGNDALRAYAEHMSSTAFQEGIADLLSRARIKLTAILCAERLPRHCHRSMIADYLVATGVPVVHLLDAERRLPHRLSDLAHMEQGRLVYDRGNRRQMNLEL
jgi:uncharacterized protein (DUF488 family)